MAKTKIYIIGASPSGLTEFAKHRDIDLEVITADEAKLMSFSGASKPEPIKLTSPIEFDIPFQAPLTRRERRKQARENQ